MPSESESEAESEERLLIQNHEAVDSTGQSVARAPTPSEALYSVIRQCCVVDSG